MNERSSEYPEIIDTLYNLQRLREKSGEEPEPALISGTEWEEDCSVLIDMKTGDRLVVTHLPKDQEEFDGATVWMSNPEGLELNDIVESVDPRDIIFWIGKAANARYYDPHSGNSAPIDSRLIADRIDFPRIIPSPVSEYDPRYVPGDSDSYKFESIFTPSTDAYTLASKIIDRVALQTGNDKVKDKNVVIGEDNQATTYDLTLKEVEPLLGIYASAGPRGFDRRFVVQIVTGEPLGFMVMPLGASSAEQVKGTGRVFSATVLREGILVAMVVNDKKLLCLPSNKMQRFIDLVLHESIGRLY